MARILIVEDDRKTAASLELYLRDAGYEVATVHDGVRGLEEARSGRFDLVLLDLMLPGLYGMDVCRQLRADSAVPIVMLTARTTEDDQVRGLDLGADDYITKPFSPRQVVARIRSVLRRHGSEDDDRVRRGNVDLDCRSLRMSVGGEVVDLTRTETRILRTLMEANGRALSREEILVRSFDSDSGSSDRTIDAHIKNLRRKLPPGRVEIVTVFGIGYRLEFEGRAG